MLVASAPIIGFTIDQNPVVTHDALADQVVQKTQNVEDGDVPWRTSQRICKPTISDDYIIYLQEHEFDVGDTLDAITYQEAIHSAQSILQLDVMKDEMDSKS